MAASKGVLTFVRASDWEGVYLDGKLLDQGHSVRSDELGKHLGYKIKSVSVDEQWLEDNSELPDGLSEVKTQKS